MNKINLIQFEWKYYLNQIVIINYFQLNDQEIYKIINQSFYYQSDNFL